jgi:hypothetical protein
VNIASGGNREGRKTMNRRQIHCYLRIGVQMNVDFKKGDTDSRKQAAVGRHASATGVLCENEESADARMSVYQYQTQKEHYCYSKP